VEPFWEPIPRGRGIMRIGSSYVLAKRDNGEWKPSFPYPGAHVQKKRFPREQPCSWLRQDRSDIKVHLEKRPPVRLRFYLRNDARIRWGISAACSENDKEGKPVQRKARRVDLSKAKVIGESKSARRLTGGDHDAYYVRKPDQDNRQVFK